MEIPEELKHYYETIRNPAFRDINDNQEVKDNVVFLAQTNFREKCNLGQEWRWKELLYEGSSLTQGANFYLDVDVQKEEEIMRFHMIVKVPSYDEQTKQYQYVFESCHETKIELEDDL